jgi:pyruvate, water dikinase
MKHNDYIIPFAQLRLTDVNKVGGKNASLGELISQLSTAGVKVPQGFATTAYAFWEFLKENELYAFIQNQLNNLNVNDISALNKAGANIRERIIEGKFSVVFEENIRIFYENLVATENTSSISAISFAVRSSATAEDLPNASFAGQQETLLNVVGIDAILHSIKEIFASLYNDRAIAYRVHQGFKHEDVALSVGIQRMVRSDLASSGVMFTIDTESGFDGVVLITAAYGLGEMVVQGAINPDEYYVSKQALHKNKKAIIRRHLGSKLQKMQFAPKDSKKYVQIVDNGIERQHFCITDEDIEQLARYACMIEKHYGCAMDIEWGKDGIDGELYILQARPETVKSQIKKGQIEEKFIFKTPLDNTQIILASGRAIGQKIGSGKVRVLRDISEMHTVENGDILVADMTDPNWEPVMKRAAGIITNRGGRTCHAAIIARELGVPAIVGCGNATDKLIDGMLVTVSCIQGDEGYVYEGLLDVEVTQVNYGELAPVPVKMMMNIGNPQLAFNFCQIPNDGVGLARMEFIINNHIGVHPQAILAYNNHHQTDIDYDLKKAIENLSKGYASPQKFFTSKLSEGIATIAAAFYPKPVILRLSDFKSNEYQKLIGGSRFEPHEENPMLGFRGVSRYIHAGFSDAFAMECQAIKYVREDMGFDNIQLMLPFVRTIEQGKKAIAALAKNDLVQHINDLKIIMMCEIPSNALLADEFLQIFDGFSIGSNDLTQLTLGLDRDSGLEVLMQDFDERDAAVKKLISMAIQAAKKHNKYIGICGQGPSDHIDFAKWLIEQGISSLSLNPDSVLPTRKFLNS